MLEIFITIMAIAGGLAVLGLVLFFIWTGVLVVVYLIALARGWKPTPGPEGIQSPADYFRGRE